MGVLGKFGNAVKTRLDRPVSFERRSLKFMGVKTRIAPTGWGFAGLTVCGFLLSVNFSNNLIFAMTFLLISLGLVGGYFTRANVKGLALSDWKTKPVFAGQQAVYTMAVGTPKGRDRYGIRPFFAKGPFQRELSFEGGQQKEMVLKRPAPRRGQLPRVAAEIRSSFPLGMFTVRMGARDLPECLVYPAPEGAQPLPEKAAGSQAHLASESGTYTDMRRYAPGDPLSRIDWKALARFDQLYTKVFDGAQGQPALWLKWEDVKASGTEARLSQLSRWVLDAHKKNREYGLAIPGVTLEPACEQSHLENCLAALACYGLNNSPNNEEPAEKNSADNHRKKGGS